MPSQKKTSSELLVPFLAKLNIVLSKTECDGDFAYVGDAYYRVLLIGNGGSQAIASHIANDLVSRGEDASSLSDPATLTCISNDRGYKNVYLHQLRSALLLPKTLLVAISSSGQSPNILKATEYAKDRGACILTCSGFSPDNPLRKLGHHNYWSPSSNYGIVECAHMALLHGLFNPGILPSP